jgi:hypothetical protein
MANFPRRELERLSHYPGQDLLARDFRGQAAVESQLRWWHNRALHGAYGVRSGLQALPVPGTSPLVAEALPGVAYDPYGRELILGGARRLAAPDVDAGGGNAPLLLVLRYREAAAAGCAAGTDTAELAWQAEALWRPTDGVPLARLTAGANGANGAAGLSWDAAFLSPFAEPLARPRIASGATLAGGTAWVPWPGPPHSKQPELGLLVWVETRAAGFTRPPCYFAWLAGSLAGSAVPPIAIVDFVGRTFLHGFYFHIRPRQVPAFTAAGSNAATRSFADFWRLARQQLAVCWIGLQMQPGSGRPARLQPEVSDEKP